MLDGLQKQKPNGGRLAESGRTQSCQLLREIAGSHRRIHGLRMHAQALRQSGHRRQMFGLAQGGITGGIEDFGAAPEWPDESCTACASSRTPPGAESPTRMPRACERCRCRRRDCGNHDALRHVDARRGGTAGHEQQRSASGADAPQFRPVAPLVLDAGYGERAEPLPTQLYDQAVGVRLRLRDDPGVGQRELRHEC